MVNAGSFMDRTFEYTIFQPLGDPGASPDLLVMWLPPLTFFHNGHAGAHAKDNDKKAF